MPNWLKSSADPAVVSNTVRGVVLAIGSYVIQVGSALNFPILESEWAGFATGIGLVAGLVWVVYGLILKVLVKLG